MLSYTRHTFLGSNSMKRWKSTTLREIITHGSTRIVNPIPTVTECELNQPHSLAIASILQAKSLYPTLINFAQLSDRHDEYYRSHMKMFLHDHFMHARFPNNQVRVQMLEEPGSVQPGRVYKYLKPLVQCDVTKDDLQTVNRIWKRIIKENKLSCQDFTRELEDKSDFTFQVYEPETWTWNYMHSQIREWSEVKEWMKRNSSVPNLLWKLLVDIYHLNVKDYSVTNSYLAKYSRELGERVKLNGQNSLETYHQLIQDILCEDTVRYLGMDQAIEHLTKPFEFHNVITNQTCIRHLTLYNKTINQMIDEKKLEKRILNNGVKVLLSDNVDLNKVTVGWLIKCFGHIYSYGWNDWVRTMWLSRGIGVKHSSFDMSSRNGCKW